jgi:hypothetical protein
MTTIDSIQLVCLFLLARRPMCRVPARHGLYCTWHSTASPQPHLIPGVRRCHYTTKIERAPQHGRDATLPIFYPALLSQTRLQPTRHSARQSPKSASPLATPIPTCSKQERNKGKKKKNGRRVTWCEGSQPRLCNKPSIDPPPDRQT